MSARRPLILVGGLFVALLVTYFLVSSVLGYWWQPIGSREIAIQMRGNVPFAVVGPGGVHTDISPFAEIQPIKIENMGFCAVDSEVFANDNQSLEIHVRGDVRRPGTDQSAFIIANWARLAAYWTDDRSLLGSGDCKSGLMANLSSQAMKVCVGQKPAQESYIGEARDALRGCIDENLDSLVLPYGLTVENVVVPNVELGEAVRTALNRMRDARLAKDLEDLEKERAQAVGERELAQRQAQIRVEQGASQETSRQQAQLAALEQTRLAAERAVIEQKSSNDLFAAQQDLAIQQAKNVAAREAAAASNAGTASLAAIYQANPEYTKLKTMEAAASAYKAGDKFVVDSTLNPIMVIGGGEVQPVVQPQANR